MVDPSLETPVILVDPFDREVGALGKLRAHQLGLLHRAFSIFVFRERLSKEQGSLPVIELLMHQRAANKYHSGLLWTNTCCSHPRIGEDLQEAASRRLQEEMGLSLPLEYAGHFIYRAQCAETLIEHEYDHVFVAWYDGQAFTPDPKEVEAFAFMALSDLTQDLDRNKARYAPWLKMALKVALQPRA